MTFEQWQNGCLFKSLDDSGSALEEVAIISDGALIPNVMAYIFK